MQVILECSIPRQVEVEHRSDGRVMSSAMLASASACWSVAHIIAMSQSALWPIVATLTAKKSGSSGLERKWSLKDHTKACDV